MKVFLMRGLVFLVYSQNLQYCRIVFAKLRLFSPVARAVFCVNCET